MRTETDITGASAPIPLPRMDAMRVAARVAAEPDAPSYSTCRRAYLGETVNDYSRGHIARVADRLSLPHPPQEAAAAA